MSADPKRELLQCEPPRRLHVLEIVGNAIIGGMERYVERLIQHLPIERFRTTVLCPVKGGFADRLAELGAEVLVVPMPEEVSWTTLQMCCALVNTRGVDVLHAHLANAHLLAGLLGRLSGLPVLATIHGRQLAMLDLEVHRVAGSHLSVVCQQSYFHALGLGVDEALLSCEPNGVDTRIFSPGNRLKGGIRDALGLNSSDCLVGFVGRLSPEKAPDLFIRAAQIALRQLPSARFVLIGEGPMAEGLNDLIKQLRLGGKVRLVGARDDMSAAFRELDMVVCSSHSEAMPLALMEAMSTGLPVIASRVGGIPDLVEDGRSGWLTTPRDSDDIARRIVQVAITPGMREEMGRLARQQALIQFELRTSTERVARLLERLVRQPQLPLRLAGVQLPILASRQPHG